MRRDEKIDAHVRYTVLDMYKLETPESVAVTYDVAGIGSRFLAALIDAIVQTVIVVALVIVTLVIAGTSSLTANNTTTGAYVALAVGTLIISVVLLGYYIFFELIWNGQSPGKRSMRLRVIGISGYPVTPFAVLVRNVLRLVDFLPAYYAVGVIAMMANKNARRLGDLAAGTIVIKEGREGTLSSLPASHGAPPSPPSDPAGYTTAPPSFAGPAPSYGIARTGLLATDAGDDAVTHGIDATRLTREDGALIRDFLDRRHALAYERRNALAYQIASLVYTHAGGDTRLFTAEGYLEQVLRMDG